MESDQGRPNSAVASFFQATGLLALGGASAGLAIACLVAWREMATFSQSNEIDRSLRYLMLSLVAGGAMVAPLVGITVAVRQRIAEPWVWLRDAACRMSPLFGVGCLPLLFNRQVWANRELDFLVLVGLFSYAEWTAVKTAQRCPGFGWERGLSAWLHPVKNGLWAALPGAIRRRWAGAVLVALALAVALRNVRSFGPPAATWGTETAFFSHLLRGGLPYDFQPTGGAPVEPHATFFGYVLGALHALVPGTNTLLVIHSVIVVGAALPLYLLGRRYLGQGGALLVAIAYLLYPALHGVDGRGLSEVPLGLGFFWLAWDGLVTRRDWRATGAMLLALATGEQVAIWLVVLGLYLILTGTRPKAGLLVAGASGLYFAAMAYFILPRHGGASYTTNYHDLLGPGRTGLTAALETALVNPGYAVSRIVESIKLVEVLKLLIPLALLPLRSPLSLLFWLPGLVFTVLTTEHGALGDLANQYNTHWAALIFVGLVLALVRCRRESAQKTRPIVAALVALLCAAIPSSHQLGAVLRRPLNPISYKLDAPEVGDSTTRGDRLPTMRAEPARHR
jgi:uncharacterized membrane protein